MLFISIAIQVVAFRPQMIFALLALLQLIGGAELAHRLRFGETELLLVFYIANKKVKIN